MTLSQTLAGIAGEMAARVVRGQFADDIRQPAAVDPAQFGICVAAPPSPSGRRA